ncbi:MAG TPA: hypothetical protein VHM65_02205, partial [Candidatus Lustribacter sp.]|nr:hypothetical protein [Candidatus Lustribacter sp.]
MVETLLDIGRCWVEFTDPADEGRRFRADLTWLTSSWGCIFGKGCRGLYVGRPDDGCCTLGAHFTDADDLERVAGAVALLTDAEWQYRAAVLPVPGDDPAEATTVTDPTRAWPKDEGDARRTRVVDGACVFLNRPGFPAGPGCALHHQAVLRGEPPHAVKPDVCWQLPIRRQYREVTFPDDSTYLEVTITE